jgi:ribosomal protein L37AE/L43A
MKASKNRDRLHGICPSCKTDTHFTWLGIQRWPEKVALSAGLPRKQTMWQCDNCVTSVMEESIIPISPKVSA